MKITASRKDEVLQRKAQYDADMKAYEERQEASSRALHEAENNIIKPIQEYLERELSKYSALKFELDLQRSWRKDNKGVRVRIHCNERNKFDDDVALAWSYEVELDADGNVVRETSSWSGLSATTEAQMTSLKQTVDALEFLNSIDWDALINVDMPDYNDYYDPNDKKPAYQNFEEELKAAELEELVGSNKIIKVNNWGESCPYRGDVWLKLLRETPSMYIVNIIPSFAVDSEEELAKYVDGRYGEYRVRKSSVIPVTPQTVREV